MTRKKVKLTYILNDTARKITFKKRKVGIVKKLEELTTLCDIEACTVIYSAYDYQPLVWPSIEEVHRLITKYQSFPKVGQEKRKVNHETFTRQRLEKIQKKLRKQLRENHHNQMIQIMFQSMMHPQTAMSRLNVEDFEELARVTDQNLVEVQRMMEIRLRDSSSFNHPPPPQFGTGGSEGGGSQQIGLTQAEFMPPNHRGFDSFLASNITYPPAPIMEFPTPNIDFQLNNMGFEPHHMNFQPDNMMFEPRNINFPHANMGFQPPNMGFQPDNMGFQVPNVDFQPANMGIQPLPTDFPQNDRPYMVDPNMGMSYPRNPPTFPYYHNNDMGPHDPSSH
ncbi:agamous-like MADS-box protein AGL80 [Impatiens glandulifera]|uniref:agamous-like MADS-box protein AGL80 n=1 Tax=Impatiens glandulifera TaxID=253017 RepID=UPI001FB0A328|nr:agamous-like MADS-box protein AGL80 [Impatiens glandulifera]